MITILSDPSYTVQVSPEIISRWLATESPNNFRLQRKDWLITSSDSDGGSPEYMQFTLSTEFTGNEGDSLLVYNAYSDSMVLCTVTDIASPATTITTDIPYSATFDGEYFNDTTLYNGYYFEGRLTVNGALESLTVIATPNSYGWADLDVSGILRIKTSLGKDGEYDQLVTQETIKSGSFTIEYRANWYGSDESYTAEGNTWYYAEAVRSVEQGSNLHEFVANDEEDAPFFNTFENPTFFAGLPFDLSFILPDLDEFSPSEEMTVTIKRYNSSNVLLNTTSTELTVDDYSGRVCSLNIDPDGIESTAAYMTVEITTT